VDEAHLVAFDVIEEDTFTLDEALVLLAWDVLPDEPALRLAFLDDERTLESDGGLGHPAAALTASMMLT
jgi:hypothetical protein